MNVRESHAHSCLVEQHISGGLSPVDASALRSIACAGALATGLLFAGIGVPFAVAQTGDSGEGPGTTGVDGTPTPDDVESEPDVVIPDGGGPAEGPSDDTNRPTSTVGNGRNDVVDPNEPIADRPGDGENAKPARKFQSTIRIPVLRLPTREEIAAPGFTPPSAYFGTAEVPVPFLADVLNAFSQPEPEPTPGPAFRTQQEAPVIDAAGNDTGGSDHTADSDAPPVFEAPLVVAPPMPLAAGARMAPIGASAARAPSVPAAPQPAVAGARTPLIRGTLPPTAASAPRPVTPMSGQATRAGYPQSLRQPTVGELSVIALPGVAGLMFLTFSGSVIGYRQANSARFVRTTPAARFLP
jgi:hypothetical protein